MTAEWGVLTKILVLGDGPAPSDGQLSAIMAALPSADRRLTGGGRDFTIWSWYEAPDAVAAVAVAAATVRAAAERAGVGRLQVVRAHAASVEGRSSPFRGIVERLGRSNQWTIYFRAAAPAGTGPLDAAAVARLGEALAKPDQSISFGGDREKFLLDDGRGVVIRLWVDGPDPAQAFRAAGAEVRAALDRAGLGALTFVRMQAATAEARYHDWFPGAEARVPALTEETR